MGGDPETLRSGTNKALKTTQQLWAVNLLADLRFGLYYPVERAGRELADHLVYIGRNNFRIRRGIPPPMCAGASNLKHSTSG